MKSLKSLIALAALLSMMQVAWAFAPGGALGGGSKSSQSQQAQDPVAVTQPALGDAPMSLPSDQLESSAEAPIVYHEETLNKEVDMGSQPESVTEDQMTESEYAIALRSNERKQVSRQQLKDALRKYRKSNKDNAPSSPLDDMLILCVILALFIPPLAVYLWEGSIGTNFWISLILTLLFFVPGVIFSLIVILMG